MGAYALTGADTFIINDRPLNDFTDNTIINIDIPNDDIGTSTGKNDNTIISDSREGGNATVTLRILMNSSDDKFLNGLYIQQKNDLPSFNLMNGSFSKRVGDGQGNVSLILILCLEELFSASPAHRIM